MQFLQDKVLDCFYIKKNCKILFLNLNNQGFDKDDQTFKYNAIQRYKMALVNFWLY